MLETRSLINMLGEALAYGSYFGEWRLDARHGDWWLWFGLPVAADAAHLRIFDDEQRQMWLTLDVEGRARFVLRQLWNSEQIVDPWIVHEHHLHSGATYGDVARQFYDEIGTPTPIADYLGILGTQQAFDMAMDSTYLDSIIDHLRRKGTTIAAGLSDGEIAESEERCRFRFPPDLCALLQRGVPVGPPFPDWRNVPDDYIEFRFNGLLDSIFFDIEHGFWHPGWGTKPADFADACNIARQELAKAPTLVPVFAHRFIPNEPLVAGNPIFSLHQTDIIYYGFHLAHYFEREFQASLPPWAASLPRIIRVWTESLNWRDDEYWPYREE